MAAHGDQAEISDIAHAVALVHLDDDLVTLRHQRRPLRVVDDAHARHLLQSQLLPEELPVAVAVTDVRLRALVAEIDARVEGLVVVLERVRPRECCRGVDARDWLQGRDSGGGGGESSW